MTTIQRTQAITFENGFLIFSHEGKRFQVELGKVSLKLKNANDFQRQLYTISPSGYGIHWPLLDEDLSFEGLLKASE